MAVYRHPVAVRVAHWLNALCLLVLLTSGLGVFNAHPALYLGDRSDFDRPLLAMTSRLTPDNQLVGLTRVGGRKNPIWRVVVADQRSKRDGRVIETVGHYNAQTQPSTIVLDEERIRSWLARGAQPSETVSRLLKTQGIVGSASS